MYIKILRSTLWIIGFSIVLGACDRDSESQYTFTSSVNLLGSSIEKDIQSTQLYFSTDNGKTYGTNPGLKVGQKYIVKVMDNSSSDFLTGKNFFSLDWSASNPKPENASADSATFTLAGSNSVVAKVVDKHCTFDPKFWTGVWKGDEVGPGVGGTDINNFRQDAANPNKLIMDNYFGDGVDAYIIFQPSTTAYDQTLTMPTQNTSEGGVASGTGTYDQCRGKYTINTTYVIGGSTYKWAYNFHK